MHTQPRPSARTYPLSASPEHPSSDDIAAAIEEASERFYDTLATWMDESVETRTMLVHNQQIGELVRNQVRTYLANN